MQFKPFPQKGNVVTLDNLEVNEENIVISINGVGTAERATLDSSLMPSTKINSK